MPCNEKDQDETFSVIKIPKLFENIPETFSMTMTMPWLIQYSFLSFSVSKVSPFSQEQDLGENNSQPAYYGALEAEVEKIFFFLSSQYIFGYFREILSEGYAHIFFKNLMISILLKSYYSKMSILS